jgi:hypothetical protein
MGRTQVDDEVGQAARSTPQMEGLKRTGHRPAHPDRAGNDRIQLLLGDHPLGDEVDRLVEQGGLQPVGDKPGDFAREHLGLFAHGAVERHRGVDHLGISPW